MRSQIFLNAPVTPDFLQALADSTSQSLKILRPWCMVENTSIALKSIKVQAKAYAEAINFSIIAAELGHAIAEEALVLAKNINDINHPDFSAEYRQSRLGEMLDMAYRGEKIAQKAHEKFRDVRTTVEGLIRDAREEQNLENTVLAHNLSKLEHDITVLEQFSRCLSMFILWWSQMKMSRPLPTPADNARPVIINCWSLLEKRNVQIWEQLKHSYEKYCIEIEHIEQTDAQLTIELAHVRREARESENEDIHSDSLTHVSKPWEGIMEFGATLDELETRVDHQEKSVRGLAVRLTPAQKQKQSQTVKSPTRTGAGLT